MGDRDEYIYLALSFSGPRTCLIASLSLSLFLSFFSLINTFYTLISTSVAYFSVDILQQSISTLLPPEGGLTANRRYSILYITSSESQSRRIARRVDGCDGWYLLDGRAEVWFV